MAGRGSRADDRINQPRNVGSPDSQGALGLKYRLVAGEPVTGAEYVYAVHVYYSVTGDEFCVGGIIVLGASPTMEALGLREARRGREKPMNPRITATARANHANTITRSRSRIPCPQSHSTLSFLLLLAAK